MPEENKTEKAINELNQRELGKVKVLMVEDDPFISELVLTKLSSSGCIPYSTTDGSEALKLAAQFKPNIVILDLMLPGLSGEEVLAGLKADESLKDIPVIVFSNKSDQADIDKVMGLGAAEYLVKASTELGRLTEIVKELASK